MNKDVQQFIDSVPKDRRPLFDRLHKLILSMYPKAEVVLWYKVPTYRTKSGWVCITYWKKGVSVGTNSADHIADFKEKHPAIKTGKASINFKITDVIPVTDLKKVIKHAMEHSK